MDTPTVTAGGSATVNPNTLNAVVTFNAASLSAGATQTVATILAATVMDQVTLHIGATSSPSTILAAATFLAPILSAGMTSFPATLLSSVTMDAVTAHAGASALVNAILAAVAMDQVILSASSTATPNTMPITAYPLLPHAGAGDAAVPVDTILATVAVFSPVVSAVIIQAIETVFRGSGRRAMFIGQTASFKGSGQKVFVG